jgi:hypothetical protein
MKTIASSILIMFISILFVAESRAQFNPSRPPAATISTGSAVAPPGIGEIDPRPPVEMKMRVVAWLGAQTREVSPEIHAHTDLPEGIGVVVEFIEPDSAAAKAGIARFDILTKFADQMLVNSLQLDALMRMRRPGEEVELTIFRKGRLQKLRIVLGKTEVPEDEFMMGAPGMMRENFMPMRFPNSAPGAAPMPEPMMPDQSYRPRPR